MDFDVDADELATHHINIKTLNKTDAQWRFRQNGTEQGLIDYRLRIGFECKDVPGSVAHLKKEGARVTQREGKDLAWVHPRDANGLFVELRHREKYT